MRSPLVNPTNKVDGPLWASQYSTSLPIQGDREASGDASSIRYRDCESAVSIDGQSCCVADRLVSSRKTRNERRRYQGLPSFCTTDCNVAAIGLSFAWLYEMKAS